MSRESDRAFEVGDQVRILDHAVNAHTRTPRYARGANGVVVRTCGRFGKPEELGHGEESGDPVELYRVRVRQVDLWPHYTGAAGDTLEIEIFEHWLETSERT